MLGTILDATLEAGEVVRKPGLTICRMRNAGTLVWNYEAPTDDPRDIKAMKRANPASWITADYLRRQAENPELTDAQVLQLHGCVWAATDTTWISPGDWMAAMRRRQLEPGEKVVLGFDASARRDSTVLAAATRWHAANPVEPFLVSRHRQASLPDDPRHAEDGRGAAGPS